MFVFALGPVPSEHGSIATHLTGTQRLGSGPFDVHVMGVSYAQNCVYRNTSHTDTGGYVSLSWLAY